MEPNPQPSQPPQWQGPERRQSLGHHPGAERRRQQAGYPTDTGVNAEPPKDEQEEHALAQQPGPNPRIPK
jgi:hypothetical protein